MHSPSFGSGTFNRMWVLETVLALPEAAQGAQGASRCTRCKCMGKSKRVISDSTSAMKPPREISLMTSCDNLAGYARCERCARGRALHWTSSPGTTVNRGTHPALPVFAPCAPTCTLCTHLHPLHLVHPAPAIHCFVLPASSKCKESPRIAYVFVDDLTPHSG